jgi:hypothetical protein
VRRCSKGPAFAFLWSGSVGPIPAVDTITCGGGSSIVATIAAALRPLVSLASATSRGSPSLADAIAVPLCPNRSQFFTDVVLDRVRLVPGDGVVPSRRCELLDVRQPEAHSLRQRLDDGLVTTLRSRRQNDGRSGWRESNPRNQLGRLGLCH